MFSSTKTSRFDASSFQVIKDAMLQSDELPLSEVIDDDQWQAVFVQNDVDFGQDEDSLGTELQDSLEGEVHRVVVATVESQPTGGRIFLFDGFTVTAADTPENQEAFPQNPAQKEGLGFPIIRCVSLIGCCFTWRSDRTAESRLVKPLCCGRCFISFSPAIRSSPTVTFALTGSLRPASSEALTL